MKIDFKNFARNSSNIMGAGRDYLFTYQILLDKYLIIRENTNSNYTLCLAETDDKGGVFYREENAAELVPTWASQEDRVCKLIQALENIQMPMMLIPVCMFCGCEDAPHIVIFGSGPSNLCRNCYSNMAAQCANCAHAFLTDYMKRSNNLLYCNSCYDRNSSVCSFCRGRFRKENIRTTKDGEPVCCGCLEHNRYATQIRNHSWKPAKFRSLSNKYETITDSSFLMGFELEVEGQATRDENLYRAAEDLTNELFYVKHDGSLSHGFELVSRPFTFDWFKDNQDKITAAVTYLQQNGFRSWKTQTCGMHVHMSKEAFSNFQLYRFLRLFYSYPKFTQWFSRRNATELAQWANPNYLNNPRAHPTKLTRRAKEKWMDNKYEAVNLRPDYTVEVRIFKGTLNNSSVFRNIEFCRAAYMFAKSPISTRSINPTEFCKYVADERKEYPNLYHQIIHSGKRKESEIDFSVVPRPKKKTHKALDKSVVA